METKLVIVISSHLSDIQTGVLTSKDVSNRANFIKWLITKHTDLNTYINADKLWEEFTKTRFFKG